MVYGDRRGAVAYAVTLCKVMEFINSGFIVKDPKTGNFSPSRFIDHAVRQRDAGARVGIVTFQMENDEQTREVTRLAKEAGFGVMEIPC